MLQKTNKKHLCQEWQSLCLFSAVEVFIIIELNFNLKMNRTKLEPQLQVLQGRFFLRSPVALEKVISELSNDGFPLEMAVR